MKPKTEIKIVFFLVAVAVALLVSTTVLTTMGEHLVALLHAIAGMQCLTVAIILTRT